MKGLTVSVGLTTYNSEKYLGEQLDSIFSQSILPDEIVVFDDASTDKTVSIIKSYMGRSTIPIRLFVNEDNIGYIKNFERCFLKCNGDIIISCDADDIWFLDKVEKVKEAFDDEKVVYVYHDAKIIDATGNIIGESLNAKWDHLENKEDREKVLMRNVRREGFPYGMTMAFRRKLLDEICPFLFAHDGYINMCAPLFGNIRYINEPLVYYRRHGNNTSGSEECVLKRALHTGMQEWLDWPVGYVKSYSSFYKKFNKLIPKEIKVELEKQIEFREQLMAVVCADSFFKGIICMLKVDGGLYEEYRGPWKLRVMDILVNRREYIK